MTTAAATRVPPVNVRAASGWASTRAPRSAPQNGSTVLANGIDTDSDEAGADNGIAADTFVAMNVVTAAGANVLAAGEVLSVVFTEDGTATLPAGRFVVSGRLL